MLIIYIPGVAHTLCLLFCWCYLSLLWLNSWKNFSTYCLNSRSCPSRYFEMEDHQIEEDFASFSSW